MLVHSLRSIMIGREWHWELSSHISSAVRKQREMNVGAQLTFFFYSHQIPLSGIVTAVSRRVFQFHLTQCQQLQQRHAQRCVSWVILDVVLLTISINHHKSTGSLLNVYWKRHSVPGHLQLSTMAICLMKTEIVEMWCYKKGCITLS